ncbi:MAG: hypothetical protein ABEK04_04885 [Candidatus Nanohalobium sp.]
MGSVSGLTAFSIVFLGLAMLVFWSVTDISGNEVIQQQMLKFQAKEIANDIELVSDYENEGYAKIILDANYTFGIADAGPTQPGPYTLALGVAGNTKYVDLNVELEEQNRPNHPMANFSTGVLCVYDDYQNNPSNVDASDVRDPEDSNPTDGSVEPDDVHVQIFPGACKP